MSTDGTSSTPYVNLDGCTLIYNTRGLPSNTWNTFSAIVLPSGHTTDSYIIEANVSGIANSLTQAKIYKISSPPVNFIYIQFRGQSAPADLYPRTTWQNISSTYAGRFFRAEGGSAVAFGSQQGGGLPNITGSIERWKVSGAFALSSVSTNLGFDYGSLWEGNDKGRVSFDASRSSSLYGAATEVRPINETMRIWKRIG